MVYLFVALHVAGALRQGALKRDTVLERMLPARR
jgi:cytochrome b561